METQVDIEKLKYPIGKFVPPASFNADEVKKHIQTMAVLPTDLEAVITGLSSEQLNYGYRQGSWNVKQIVHHLADSHLNFHVRLRLPLTENVPTIKPYDENAWAKLPDANNDDLSFSLMIVKGVHARAVELMNLLSETDLKKEYFHPDNKKNWPLFWLIGLYAWHGHHHVAQVKVALQHKF